MGELQEACAPWENGSTEIPDWDSPLHIVFQAGISYALQQVGAAVGAEFWEGSDGTETIEGDVHVEICNILKAADMYEDEVGTYAKHAELTTLRATLSRQAELLEAARDALEKRAVYARLKPNQSGDEILGYICDLCESQWAPEDGPIHKDDCPICLLSKVIQ